MHSASNAVFGLGSCRASQTPLACLVLFYHLSNVFGWQSWHFRHRRTLPLAALTTVAAEEVLDDPGDFQGQQLTLCRLLLVRSLLGCERFASLYLLEDGAIVDQVATYRGEGQTFL